jgi:hypothetical protein
MTACCRDYEENKQTYRCEKHGIDMCDACLRCKDPELYCKFRSACMIHFLEKERAGGGEGKSAPEKQGGGREWNPTGKFQ